MSDPKPRAERALRERLNDTNTGPDMVNRTIRVIRRPAAPEDRVPGRRGGTERGRAER